MSPEAQFLKVIATWIYYAVILWWVIPIAIALVMGVNQRIKDTEKADQEFSD